MVVGLAKFVAGTVAALYEPSFLLGVNTHAVPRYLPHGISVAIAAASLLTWGPLIHFRALAGWWALAAGAFARPALLFYGLPEPRLEVIAIPVAAVLIGLAIHPGTRLRTRLVILATLAAPVAVIVALAVPSPTVASQFAGTALYTSILIAAGSTSMVAAHSRREPA